MDYVQHKISEGDYTCKLLYPKDRKDPNYKELVRAYHEEYKRLTEQLKNDLFKEYGVVGHPKAQLVWEKAWSLGHSNGLSEVVCYFADLVEIIQ